MPARRMTIVPTTKNGVGILLYSYDLGGSRADSCSVIYAFTKVHVSVTYFASRPVISPQLETPVSKQASGEIMGH